MEISAMASKVFEAFTHPGESRVVRLGGSVSGCVAALAAIGVISAAFYAMKNKENTNAYMNLYIFSTVTVFFTIVGTNLIPGSAAAVGAVASVVGGTGLAVLLATPMFLYAVVFGNRIWH